MVVLPTAGAIVIQGNGKDNAGDTAHVNKVNGIVIGANYDKCRSNIYFLLVT